MGRPKRKNVVTGVGGYLNTAFICPSSLFGFDKNIKSSPDAAAAVYEWRLMRCGGGACRWGVVCSAPGISGIVTASTDGRRGFGVEAF